MNEHASHRWRRRNSRSDFAEIHPPFTNQEAVVEANRCLFCFDAPCTNACPTHIDVPRFIKKIATRQSARLGADHSRRQRSGR